MAIDHKVLKRSSSSFTGGCIVGLAVAVLTILIMTELEFLEVATRWSVAVGLGSAFGAWVRIADL